MRIEKSLNYNHCLNHGLYGLKDNPDFKAEALSKKSVKSEPSVAIRDSDNMQKEVDQYLTQLVR